MTKTLNTTLNHLDKKWYVIDGKNKTLGRLASQISQILMGKHKSVYSPYQDNGDYVIILNVEHLQVSGKKETQKLYRYHSGRPGGMKIENLNRLRQRKPERILEHAVRGMLPKNRLGRKMMSNLKVYKGEQHPHIAQKPIMM